MTVRELLDILMVLPKDMGHCEVWIPCPSDRMQPATTLSVVPASGDDQGMGYVQLTSHIAPEHHSRPRIG